MLKSILRKAIPNLFQNAQEISPRFGSDFCYKDDANSPLFKESLEQKDRQKSCLELRILKKVGYIIASLCMTSIIHSMEGPTFLHHAKEYAKFIGISHPSPFEMKVKEPKEALEIIFQYLEQIKDGILINKGEEFGLSFTVKNEPPLNYAQGLLTGQMKQWKKEQIISIGPKFADIGCGFGLGAVYLTSNLVKFYEKEKWKFTKPIEIDLYDVNPLHKEGLSHLSSLINLAYPEYFKISSFEHDIKKELSVKEHYNVMWALSLVHFIPSTDWKAVFTNMASAVKKNGMLFVLTDDFVSTIGADQFALASKQDPFICPILILFNQKYGLSKGLRIENFKGEKFLKNDKVHKPNASYKNEDLDLIKIEKIIKTISLAVKAPKDREIPLLYDGTNKKIFSIKETIRMIETGTLDIYCANYVFGRESLEKAIFSSLGENNSFKKIDLSWTNSLYQDKLSGITLMKK